MRMMNVMMKIAMKIIMSMDTEKMMEILKMTIMTRKR
jgi:hypothetical protein